MPSPEYTRLTARIAELETGLLPATPASQTSFSQQEIDRIFSFFILCSAELENFVEDKCGKLADRAHAEWHARSRITYVARNLVLGMHAKLRDAQADHCFYNDLFELRQKPAFARANPARVTEQIDKAVTSYKARLSGNHGIRDANLRNILFPIGIRDSQLDITWIATVEQFSDQRGHGAHKSVSATTTMTIPHPTTAKATVAQILVGMNLLDRILVSLHTR